MTVSLDQPSAETLDGFKPAGPEWLAALHLAQQEARQIARTKGIPDNRGKIKFYIAAAEDFTNESRRTLHAHGMGWFRLSTGLVEVNAHTGTLKLTGVFVVYHAPSGQAKRFSAEWTARSDGDALAGAHTRLTRRFIQGLLQVAVVDEGSEPEDPPAGSRPAGCSHPPHAVFPHGVAQWNAQKACWVSEMVCKACGADMGWGPCDAPEQQQTIPAPAPVPQQQAPAPGSAPQYQNTSFEGGPPQGGYQAPAQAPTPLPPVAAEPMVQHAMQALGAEPVSTQQMRQEQAEPIAATDQPGSPEAWRDGLIAKGLDPGNALQVAILDDARVVELDMVELMRGWAFDAFTGDNAKIRAAWAEVGFEAVSGIPVDQRPRPTGLQSKKFLSAITFKPAAAGA